MVSRAPEGIIVRKYVHKTRDPWERPHYYLRRVKLQGFPASLCVCLRLCLKPHRQSSSVCVCVCVGGCNINTVCNIDTILHTHYTFRP